MAFALPVKLSLSQPTSFLTFTLPLFTMEGVSRWLCGAWLLAGVKPRHLQTQCRIFL